MSLRQKIVKLLSDIQKPMSMKDIYTHFPGIARTTVRGRVYDSLNKGVVRVGKGLYITSTAVVENGDSLKIIDRMIREGDLFDFIFLDIPYDAAGQKGGNRDLFACDKISVEEFKVFIDKCSLLLKDDTSPLLFMFTSGTTSKRAHDKYFNQISLKQCPVLGTYQKMWSTGNPMNMGKYIMPKENIYVFTKSGLLNPDLVIPDLNFRLVPDLKEYPTAKPYEMIETLVRTFTKIGDWVLDPFGGSGKTLKACLNLQRFCHIIDSSPRSLNNHLLPLILKS